MQNNNSFQSDANVATRQRTAKIGRSALFASFVFAMIALIVLFSDVINDIGGYTVWQNSTPESDVASKPIAQLNDAELAGVLNNNLTSQQVDKLLVEALNKRGQAGTAKLLQDDVLKPIDPNTLADKPLDQLNSDELATLLKNNLPAERLEIVQANNIKTVDQLDAPALVDLVNSEVLAEISVSQLSDAGLDTLKSDELIALVQDNFGPKNIARLTNPSWQTLPQEELLSLIESDLFLAPDATLVSSKPAEELNKDELLQIMRDWVGARRLEKFSVAALELLSPTELITIVKTELTTPIDLAALIGKPLTELSTDEAIAGARQHLPPGLFNLFTAKALEESGRDDLIARINSDVLRPAVKESWGLFDSVFNRAKIEQEASAKYPGVPLQWRWWLNTNFLTNVMSSTAEVSGIRVALLGSLWMIALTILIAVPLGIGAAIYLEEFAGNSQLSKLIQINIYNLAGVPSIIYGMLGLTIFVRVLEPLTSGQFLGVTDSNGRTIISAALTMALLILPLIIINTQEALRAVPSALKEAAYGVGLTKLETIWHHILPSALPGMLTGTILAMSRAIGETAPLIVIGASTFIAVDPSGPFSKFTVLPIQIYKWTSLPDQTFRNIAAAAIVILLVLLITLNLAAILLRNRYRKEQ